MWLGATAAAAKPPRLYAASQATPQGAARGWPRPRAARWRAPARLAAFTPSPKVGNVWWALASWSTVTRDGLRSRVPGRCRSRLARPRAARARAGWGGRRRSCRAHASRRCRTPCEGASAGEGRSSASKPCSSAADWVSLDAGELWVGEDRRRQNRIIRRGLRPGGIMSSTAIRARTGRPA